MDEDDEVQRGDLGWMSVAKASERLGVRNRTSYRFIDEGELSAYKFGRVIRLQRADVDAFIERNRVAPGSLQHLLNQPKGDSAPADGIDDEPPQ